MGWELLMEEALIRTGTCPTVSILRWLCPNFRPRLPRHQKPAGTGWLAGRFHKVQLDAGRKSLTLGGVLHTVPRRMPASNASAFQRCGQNARCHEREIAGLRLLVGWIERCSEIPFYL